MPGGSVVAGVEADAAEDEAVGGRQNVVGIREVDDPIGADRDAEAEAIVLTLMWEWHGCEGAGLCFDEEILACHGVDAAVGSEGAVSEVYGLW